jgi:hypothetical protein
MTSSVGLVLLIGLAACARRTGASSEAQHPTQDLGEAAPVISLDRTPCFGTCPVYTISVTASGQVTFEGRAHVPRPGVARAEIPRQRVDSLLVELERAGYFGFAGRYAASEPACGRYVADLPSAIISVTRSGRTKRIEHDHGCGSAPGALAVLEKRIDEVLGSDQWLGRSR